MLCITESWLDSSVVNSEFIPRNYNVFRSDRDFSRSGRQRGGGVVLATNGKFSVKSLDLALFTDFCLCDIVGCKLCYEQISLYVSVVYIPPNISVADLYPLLNVSKTTPLS
mgnify:FL=1